MGKGKAPNGGGEGDDNNDADDVDNDDDDNAADVEADEDESGDLSEPGHRRRLLAWRRVAAPRICSVAYSEGVRVGAPGRPAGVARASGRSANKKRSRR